MLGTEKCCACISGRHGIRHADENGAGTNRLGRRRRWQGVGSTRRARSTTETDAKTKGFHVFNGKSCASGSERLLTAAKSSRCSRGFVANGGGRLSSSTSRLSTASLGSIHALSRLSPSKESDIFTSTHGLQCSQPRPQHLLRARGGAQNSLARLGSACAKSMAAISERLCGRFTEIARALEK
jgi:hypothetical protein